MPKPKEDKNAVVKQLEERPTETATGFALAVAVYGFLTQAAVGTALAAIIAVVVAFGPTVISAAVDRVRDR